ncbi:hypothetical protein ACOZCG_26950 [Streptomyces pseudogriseolus]|uniref:hypothetical protein n=1 Tax=Streptomyces pseudogriseolus TaxID=36817 RepID=UPI003FA329CE
MQHRTSGSSDREGDGQALAVTLALLLLTGGVLMLDAVAGPYVAFTAVAVPIVAAYAARPAGLLRALAVRRAMRRLIRSLPGS